MLPVFLGRRPAEPTDQDFAAFHARLLKETAQDVFRNGTWRLCDALSSEIYDRSGDEIRDFGLYVDLKPWGYYVFAVRAG